MRQSLDTIRDTVMQACVTALSVQSITPFHSSITVQDRNVNNHLSHLIQSEYSFQSRKTNDCCQNHQFRTPSVIRQKNKIVFDHKLYSDNVIDKKQRIHHRARTSPYPMYKNVLRTLVNDNQVPWSYQWLQYKPTTFTAEEIYINPGADPGTNKVEKKILLYSCPDKK